MASYSNKLQTQNDLLLSNLMVFYNNKEHLQRIMGIINGESKISLRIVDWFVTNYAKKNYTMYSLNDEQRFKVYNDYKLKLKAYSKKRFDPFCRWERITIPYDNTKQMETTIGQLNFFKWAIDNLIIDYIKNNYVEIEDDMNICYNSVKVQKKEKKEKNERKRRQELSKSASRGLNSNNMKVVLDFN